MKKIRGVLYCTPWDLEYMLGVSRLTIYRWIKKKTIPALKIFGRLYVPMSWVDQYLKNLGEKNER